MRKLNSMSEIKPKYLIISFLFPILFQSTIFIFQLSHGIISIWNIVSTAMISIIFANAIKMSRNDYKKNSSIKDPDIITGGTTIEKNIPKKRKVYITLIIIAISIVFGILSAVFFNQHAKKSENLSLITAEVISQNGSKTITKTEEDNETTYSEKESIEVQIKYYFNGEEKLAQLSSNTTSKIYIDELKIYIDQSGDLVTDYGRIFIWKIEAIIFLVFSILMLATAIFSLDFIFITGITMTGIATSLLFLVGAAFIENILYNDIICFLSMFINIGIYIITYWIISLILVGKNGINNYIYTTEQKDKTKTNTISN